MQANEYSLGILGSFQCYVLSAQVLNRSLCSYSYANSVLQALYFCAPFREQVLQYADTSTPDLVLQTPHAPQPPPTQPSPVARWKPERKFSGVTPDATNGIAVAGPVIPSSPPTLFSALRSLFLYISQNPSDKGTVAPRAFIEKLKDVNELFRSTMHQDAHEFLNYLLNKIVEEMEEERKQLTTPNGDDCEDAVTFAFPPSRNLPSLSKVSNSLGTLPSIAPATTNSSSGTSQAVTLVHRLFEGVLTSETRCLTCETVSATNCLYETSSKTAIGIFARRSFPGPLRRYRAEFEHNRVLAPI
jgi:ubiquitin carboxyl-terminal hydrolase 9/13